jgi:hypothetical protein
MRRRNLCLMGKLGICILLLTFVILPISPSTSLAAGDAAAAGAAGAGSLTGLSTLSIVGITVLGIVVFAAIVSSLSDEEAVSHH